MRGYAEFHRYKYAVRKFRLQNNFVFFSEMKEKLEHELQIEEQLKQIHEQATVEKKPEPVRVESQKIAKSQPMNQRRSKMYASAKKPQAKSPKVSEKKKKKDNDEFVIEPTKIMNEDIPKSKSSTKEMIKIQKLTYAEKSKVMRKSQQPPEATSALLHTHPKAEDNSKVMGGDIPHDEFRKRFHSLVPKARDTDGLLDNTSSKIYSEDVKEKSKEGDSGKYSKIFDFSKDKLSLFPYRGGP